MWLRINSNTRRYKRLRTSCSFWFLVGLVIACWFGYLQLKSEFLKPQALLVLGGATEREVFAAKFAQKHPQLPIWVSSGSNPEFAEWVFSEAGIKSDRLHLDYRAVDTVTNFTTLVDELKARGIESVYLITSDDHMRRAEIIGEIVLGSRGISFKPVAVPSGRTPEPVEKAVRDGARALLWLTTGYTGANFSQARIE
ncbi:YdcF family protein [Tychonema sp. LEGE 07199]|uniref:YdcF family protein n=1 Tax=Microcoleaceae TaxID=1892252 RepID=UPI001881A40B|nr:MULTISPECIES: YdcF family protein [unclassified Tychonema]MBE9121461.1 YdcF family protein [Tychonema sp. LEGE 07199]MBE9133716.1 YdcF family protein [Tychonema sp. LEGE 07196]